MKQPPNGGVAVEHAPELESVELRSPAGYRSEHDAMVLLYRLRNLYAPVRLFSAKRGK